MSEQTDEGQDQETKEAGPADGADQRKTQAQDSKSVPERTPPAHRMPPVRRVTFGRPTNIRDADYGLDFGRELDEEQGRAIREFRKGLEAKARAYEERERAKAAERPARLSPPKNTHRKHRPPPADSRRGAMKVYGRAMARCESALDQLLDYDERALDLSDKFTALDLTQGVARSIAALGHAFNRLCLANKHHLTIDRGAAPRKRGSQS